MMKITLSKKSTFIVFSILILTAISIIYILSRTSTPKLITAQASWVVDFSDDRNLVGFSDNVFIGKVKSQKGTVKSSDGKNTPQTQYVVEIIENIKGDLGDNTVITFDGGYDGDKLYLIEKAEMLKPGKTYLFSGRYDETNGTVFTVPGFGEKLIDENNKIKDVSDHFKKALEQEVPFLLDKGKR